MTHLKIGIPIKLFITGLILVSQLQSDAQVSSPAQNIKGLKDYYKNYFPIGVAVSPWSLKDPEDSKLILQQFNSVTPENAMKMGPIHPRMKIFTTGKMPTPLLRLPCVII